MVCKCTARMSTGGEAPHHQLAPRGALCNTSPLTITLRVLCIFAAPGGDPSSGSDGDSNNSNNSGHGSNGDNNSDGNSINDGNWQQWRTRRTCAIAWSRHPLRPAHTYRSRNWSFYTSAHMAWFEVKERSLNLKFKPHNIYFSFKTCNYK
jgi:hypothetical protein